MKSQVLSQFNIPMLPVIALILFTTLFAGVVWWVTKKSNRERYEQAAQIPLSEGEKHE